MDTQTRLLKGFRDFLPDRMAIRNEVINRLKRVFESFGFDEIQTPSIEYQSVLLGKYGEEAEKLMYLFEDPGKRKVGLRYDLTVPFARVTSTYTTLPTPFKRYQIQPVYRADKPQKGRYREVYQCDIDIAGSDSPLADAEIINVIDKSLKSLDFNNFKIRVNSRSVLFSVMEKSGITNDLWLSAIQSIDKLEKKAKEEIEKELSDKGFSIDEVKNIFKNLSKAKPDSFLNQTIKFAKDLGADSIIFDPILSRGLDYYTGPIFESKVEEPKIGSVTGGGRFDKLLQSLGGPDIPATGTSIGLDRVCDVIEELKLWPDIANTNSSALVTVFSEETVLASIDFAKKLRERNVNCELYPNANTKLHKQLKYADKKGIPFVITIGPDEIEKDKVSIKNMKTGEQNAADYDTAISLIKSANAKS